MNSTHDIHNEIFFEHFHLLMCSFQRELRKISTKKLQDDFIKSYEIIIYIKR